MGKTLTDNEPTKSFISDFESLFSNSEKNKDLNINLEEFVILLFGYAPEHNVHGKTRFQKLIYLLNDKFKIFKNLNYFRYYYGPFSRKLEKCITNLKIINYIHEDIIYFYNDRLKYKINLELTEKGLKKFNEILGVHQDQSEKLAKIFNFLEENNYFEMNLKDLLSVVYQKAGYL